MPPVLNARPVTAQSRARLYQVFGHDGAHHLTGGITEVLVRNLEHQKARVDGALKERGLTPAKNTLHWAILGLPVSTPVRMKPSVAEEIAALPDVGLVMEHVLPKRPMRVGQSIALPAASRR